jgi:hypothetical protein
MLTYSPHAFNGAFLESMAHALTNVTLQLILVPSMVPFQNIDNITSPSSMPLMVPFNIITSCLHSCHLTIIPPLMPSLVVG